MGWSLEGFFEVLSVPWRARKVLSPPLRTAAVTDTPHAALDAGRSPSVSSGTGLSGPALDATDSAGHTGL